MSVQIGDNSLEAYILNVAPQRRDALSDALLDARSRISESVPRFSVGPRCLVVFVSLEEGRITHFAEGKRGARAATGSILLQMRDPEQLDQPVPFGELLDAVPASVRHHLQRYLNLGGLLPPTTNESVVHFMVDADRGFHNRLEQLKNRANPLWSLSEKAAHILGLQKDALGIALRAGGIELHHLTEWSARAIHRRSRFFLEGITPRYTENSMVRDDFETVPGLELFDSTGTTVRHFQSEKNPSRKMTVIMAANEPLEWKTGVDLIYFNEEYESFTMVQYKVMESRRGGPAFNLRSNDRLFGQIQRMDEVWEQVRIENTGLNPSAFRFSRNPFFLKFCPRKPLEPDSTAMFPGMYLPLSLWKRLHESGSLVGPRSGNVLTYDNVGRWLTNSDFITLLSRSWVGTSPRESAMLQKVISKVLAPDSATVYAHQHAAEGSGFGPFAYRR